MSHLLLPPVLLLSSAIGSSAYLFLTSSSPSSRRTGDIFLPPSLLPSSSDERPKELNIDVEIDPTSFYPNLRIHKLFLMGGLGGLLLESVFEVCWRATLGGEGKQTGADGLMVAYWLICIILLSFSLTLSNTRVEIDRHWSYTVTLAVLTLLALATTLTRLVLPDSLSSTGDSAYKTLNTTLTAVRTFLQIYAFYYAGTTQRCAPLGKYAAPLLPDLTKDSTELDIPLRVVSALPTCSPTSYCLFQWISPVLAVGASVESLSESDLPLLGANDRADNLWEKIKGSHGRDAPSWANQLLWRCLKVNKRLFYWQAVLALVNSFLYYLPAFFLQQLIAFLEFVPPRGPDDPPRSLAWGYAFCLGLLVSALVEAVVSGQLWFVSNSMLATRLRTQLNCLVFDKTLKRQDVAGVSASNKPKAAEDSTSGEEDDKKDETKKGMFESNQEENFGSKSQVMNLFSIDVDRVADFSIWCFSIIDAPAEVIIGTFFLYKLLGYAAFVGISVAVLFLPLNHFTSTAFASVQDKLMSARDKRVSLMNEVLQSIRMIKYMGFEQPFEDKILVTRREELKQLKRNFLLEVSFNAIWSTSPILCVLVSFWVFTGPMGRELTPSIAFASLAVWNELRFALNIIPEILVQAIQCLISLRRIEKYLESPEVEVVTEEHNPSPSTYNDKVAFISATCTWPSTPSDTPASVFVPAGTKTPSNTFELQDISVEFPTGQLSLVCGSLGSGKTLLLLALLGEAEVLAGSVLCPKSAPDAISLPNIEWDRLITEENWVQENRTAYVPQTAWLQNASIRLNICFGLPYREKRYQSVLAACSLLSDLLILEDGDETEIGEKGVNLSGGQKARVSLARAVYSRASLLLLDDVLSAVDAHTALHIFNVCLKGPLMEGRTVVLVSHHVQLCAPGADYVVSLDNGRVKFEGPSEVFLKSDRFKSADDEEEPVETQLAAIKTSPKAKNRALIDLVTESAPASESGSVTSDAESDTESDEAALLPREKITRKLIEDEGRAVGRVDRSVWSLYLGISGGALFWFAFAFAFGGAKLADVAQTFWLNIWAGSYDAPADGRVTHEVSYYLGLYAVLSFVSVIVGTMQWFVLYTGSLRASERLYVILLRAILRAPLRFFDTQALGRILNRFGKDFEGVDAALPDHLGRSLMYSLGVFTTLTVVASVAPSFLLGFGLLSIIYYHYAKLFSKSARELRRLDSVSKSPLYSIYGEAVVGVAVIRAFGSSSRFMALMLDRCSTNVCFYWYLWSVNRWLSIRFAMLSAIVVALTGYVLISANGRVDAALAGFALTFSLNIANDVLFLVRRYTALELAMVAVERIKEYSEIEPERALIVHPRPAPEWPNAGKITVENLSIRYAPDLPDVLHELNFTVKAGDKVGIVGATGCGKSTLALSFFRFVEAWSGSIKIDDLDIAKVGLQDLRSNLTIIPQDPTILSGTLRSTLDIFNDYEDNEIYDALRRVHLLPPIGETPVEHDEGANKSPFESLDGEVSEGGGNFSQGQRQLLCMARALLKRNRVLLLDEATASVDYETDELISATIRQEFSNSTLLVIAHRLRTVIDFDKILVLDAGRILEYDHPSKLLADPTSRFYSLCRASGKSEFKILKKMADGRAKATPRKLPRTLSTKGALKSP